MRYTIIPAIALAVSFFGVCDANEPQAAALRAITTLFVNHDLASFKTFVAEDARQGDGAPGSAFRKLSWQRPEQMSNIELAQIIFFRKQDIDKLEQSYPDDLWVRVRKHIGNQQGVIVKMAMTGALADRVRAAGKDPRDTAMMTFILSSDKEPRIIHIDDN